MRFNTVEIEHAYFEYLDSLEDGPPSGAAPPVTAVAAMERSNPELDAASDPQYRRIPLMHH